MKKQILLIALLVTFLVNGLCQGRWTHSYLESEDSWGYWITESYDGGYLLSGRYGSDNPLDCWLIKTDINGDVLWKRDFGNDVVYSSVTYRISQSQNGDIYLAGTTNLIGGEDHDPIIMKLNACGEKEWCQSIVEEGNNYIRAVRATSDGGAALLLSYMNELLFKDRVGLARFDSSGILLWKHYFNNSDTAMSNQEGEDLTLTLDGGFLISGDCCYKDPDPPHMSSSKPYYIKTDYDGNIIWERIFYKDSGNYGGTAWSTELDPNEMHYYSSLHHRFPGGDAPALLKMDLLGNLVDIYNLTPSSPYGSGFRTKFLSDTSLIGNLRIANGYNNAVVFDTLGNIIHQTNLNSVDYVIDSEVSFDNKLLYITNTHEGNNVYSTSLFKFNSNLLGDTIYSTQLTYDSLCPYQITNDTIALTECGLIVGTEEIIYQEDEEEYFLLIYPNPASSYVTLSSSNYHLQLHSLQGQQILTSIQGNEQISVEGVTSGIYVATIREGENVVGREKLIVK